MPVTLPTTVVLALFYTVFLSQILLVSIYYPGKLCRRVNYVRTNFPRAEYPKLYPADFDRFAEERGKRGLSIFRTVNYIIAAIGVMILLAMVISGYRPDPKGGDEIFVVMYFFLQVCPLFYAELKEFKQYRLMREAFSSTTRKANLRRRRLLDFLPAGYLVTAGLLYVAWLLYYLYDKGFGSPWEVEVYITLVTVTGINLGFAVVVAKLLLGKKLNPHQAYKDQLKHIESVAKMMVFSSAGISVFLITTIAVDRYALEVLDPPLMSLYMQMCITFGLGFIFRKIEIEGIDFEVYRDDPAGVSI